MALTNNDILKKLRVALQLRDDDIVEILKLAEYEISKSELGAFFRKESHPKYMLLQDQILRNFLNGLIIYKRGVQETKQRPPVPSKQTEQTTAEQKASVRKRIERKPAQSDSSKKVNYSSTALRAGDEKPKSNRGTSRQEPSSTDQPRKRINWTREPPKDGE